MAYISADIYAPTPDAPTLRTPINPPTFRDGEIVVVTAGTMRGITGKIVQSDSRPGTASVYVPAWGSIAHNVAEASLLRLPS